MRSVAHPMPGQSLQVLELTMEAISAIDEASANVKTHDAKYVQIIPARPPLMSAKVFVSSSATHVDIVVTLNPKTDSDLKLRRSSWVRPRRAISRASASVPVCTPTASV